jgi:hypothetical protein
MSGPVASRQLIEIVRPFLKMTGVDRAVFYALLARAWSVPGGVVTLLLITAYLTPRTQGFYFTIQSILNLQIFLEVGFHMVLVNVASNEWAHLSLDNHGRIVGDSRALSRLVSLGRFAVKWYLLIGAVFMLVVGVPGYIFFAQDEYPGIAWKAPWFTVVLAAGLQLLSIPAVSILDGCNQVKEVNLLRLWKVISMNVALWLALVLDLGLWSLPITYSMDLMCTTYFVLVRNRVFFRCFCVSQTGPTMRWSTEIWPFQWRLAVSGITTYFGAMLFNPVMFHYHGAVVAGQMGMTRRVVEMIRDIGSPWLLARIPKYGMLVGRQDYEELDSLWLKSSLVSLAAVVLGSCGCFLVIWLLNSFVVEYSQRFLALLPFGLFLLAACIFHVGACQTAYLRAHKQEPIPLLLVNIFTNLGIGLSVWLLGASLGPTGAAGGYLAVVFAFATCTTLLWLHYRSKWHGTPSQDGEARQHFIERRSSD